MGCSYSQTVGAALTGQDSVLSMAFSPDGRTLAATDGVKKTIWLWDVRSHRARGTPLTGNAGVISLVAFSPDGRTLASAAADTVQIWKNILWHSFADLQTEVCDLVGSGLSETEWAQYAPGIPYHQSCS